MKRSRKNKRKLAGRIADWENTMKQPGDTARKHPRGFKKPGAQK